MMRYWHACFLLLLTLWSVKAVAQGDDCDLSFVLDVQHPTVPPGDNGAINGQVIGWNPRFTLVAFRGAAQIPISRPNDNGAFRLEGLDRGVYRLIAADPDNLNCNIDTLVLLNVQDEDCNLKFETIETQPETIPPGNNGSVTIRISGGTPPFTFNLQDRRIETMATEVTVPNLPSGTYSIVVFDSSRPVFCTVLGEARVERVCEGVDVATIVGLDGGPYCHNSSAPLGVTGIPVGGTFSGPGIRQIGPGRATFTPSEAGPGEHFITYSGTNAQGCEYRGTARVVVLDNCCPAPRTIIVQVESTTLASVQWEAVVTGGGPVLGYEIRFSPVGRDEWTTVFSAVASATLALPPGVSNRWKVQVRAVCQEDVRSDWSREVEFETGIDPCEPPTGLEVFGIQEFSVSVRWNPVANATAYRIEYRERESALWQPIVVGSSPTTFTLSGLARASSYFIRIVTLCVDGQTSPSSDPQTFRTLGVDECLAPQDVTIGQVGETTIALTWEAIGGSSQYQVWHRVRGSSDNWTTATTTSTSYTIVGLAPGTTYEIEVITQCGSVVSEPSVRREATTQDFQPKCNAPASVTVTNVTEDRARVNWTATQGAIQYEIRYAEEGSGNWQTRFSASSPLTLLNLKPRTRYEVQVKAICGPDFESERTNPVVFETPRSERCLAPVSTAVVNVDATTAQVSWEAVHNALTYVVRYRLDGSNSAWTEIADIVGTETLIENLTPQTAYEFQVAVKCDNDKTSTFTLSRDFETTELVCNPPSPLTISNITTSEVTVEWPAAANARSYTLRWRTAPNGAFTTVLIEDETQYRITGLNPNTLYQIEVRTNCAAGVSSGFGPAEEFRTLNIDPSCGTPSDITFTNVSGTTAEVSWSAVLTATRYIVEYRRITDLDWQSVTAAGTTVTLENLQNETRYLVRLRAECPGGLSPDSPQTDFTTGNGAVDCTGWTRAGTGPDQVRVEDVAWSSGNAVAICGSFTGSANFGPNAVVSAGDRDGFVALMNEAGQYLWVQTISGDFGIDNVTAVTVDAQSNVYVSGYFMLSAQLSPTVTIDAFSPYTSAFVAKYSSTGALLWANIVDSPNAFRDPGQDSVNVAWDVALGIDGSVYLAGQHAFEAEFTSTGGSSEFRGNDAENFSDAFLAKYDNDGQLLWVRTGSSPFVEAATAVKVDASGQVYLTGYYSLDADFDGFPLASLNPATLNVFLAQYTDDGTVLGVRGAAGTGTEAPFDLVVDGNQNVYIAGVFNQSYSAGSTTLNARGQNDVFITRVDVAGNGVWTQQIGGAGEDYASQLDFDPQGNLMVAGYFQGVSQFGSQSETSDGMADAYIARLDRASGAVVDVRHYGSAGSFVIATGYDNTSNGTEYLSGIFAGSVLVSENPVLSSGQHSGFTAKLCPDAVVLPCEPSDLVLSTEIAREGAKISWNPAPNAALYVIRYRVEGATEWITLEPVVSSPIVLSGLTSKTTYELQIRTVCTSGRESDFTTPEVFTTLGDCIAPEFIAADYTTATTAELNWARSPGAVQYEVYYKRAAGGDALTRVVVIDTFTILRNLLPNTRYEFFVRAHCDVDEFAPDTPPVNFSTLTGGCAGPPSNFRITQVGPSTARVAWDRVDNIEDYQIQWRRIGTRTWNTVSSTGTQYQIVNLVPNADYEVRVRANCGGINNQSPWARAIPFQTERLCPDAGPITVVDSTGTTLTLSWEAVEGVLNYQVYYRRKDDPNWSTVTGITGTTYTITGLNQITRYEVALRTFCTNGTRSPIGPIRETVTPLLCQRPTMLTVDEVNVTTAVVSWSEVRSAISYELQYREVEAESWTTVIVPADQTTRTIINLKPDMQYEVRLRANCERNASSEFLSTVFQTEICGTPSFVEVVSRTTTEINIRWTPVFGAVEYYIEYRKRGDLEWQRILVIDETEYPITNLQPQTDYEIQVVVDCITGVGQPSRRIIATTTAGCNPPNLITSTTTAVTATLNWNAMPGATGYWVYWRAPLFSVDYDSAFVNGTSLTVNNLRIGQRYEARIKTICGNGPSAMSLFHDFVTDNFMGCRTPANFRAEPALTSITLRWVREPGAVRYSIAFRRRSAFASWSTVTINDPVIETYTLTNLLQNEEYEIRIRSICASTFSEWALLTARTLSNSREESLLEATTSEWRVYPNPTRGPLTVQAPAAAGPVRLELFDLSGRSVYRVEERTRDEAAFEWQLNLPAELAPGLYLIRLERGGAETRLKLWVK